MDERGQISTLDLLIASVIFANIVIAAAYIYSDTIKTAGRMSEETSLALKVRDVSEALAATAGEPPSWHEMTPADINSTSVHALGLSREDNILDSDKTTRLDDIDYEDARTIMGLSREDYNITITDASGSILYSTGKEAGGRVAVSERLILFEGDKAKLSVKLFREGGG